MPWDLEEISRFPTATPYSTEINKNSWVDRNPQIQGPRVKSNMHVAPVINLGRPAFHCISDVPPKPLLDTNTFQASMQPFHTKTFKCWMPKLLDMNCLSIQNPAARWTLSNDFYICSFLMNKNSCCSQEGQTAHRWLRRVLINLIKASFPCCSSRIA